MRIPSRKEVFRLFRHIFIDLGFIVTHYKTFFRNVPKSHKGTSIIILASGTQERWKATQLKQLSLIGKVPLIQKTLSQLKNEAVIATIHPQLMNYPHIVPSKHRWTTETLISTMDVWKNRTIILLGDVLYSDNDLKTILEFKGDYAFFGSFSQGEIFAFSFSTLMSKKVVFHLNRVIFHAQWGGRGKLWELYRSLVGLPLHWHRRHGHFINMTQSTDFDTYDEYQNFIQHGSLKKWGNS